MPSSDANRQRAAASLDDCLRRPPPFTGDG